MSTWFKLLEIIKSRDDLLTAILFNVLIGVVVAITLPIPLIAILIYYFAYITTVIRIESNKSK